MAIRLVTYRSREGLRAGLLTRDGRVVDVEAAGRRAGPPLAADVATLLSAWDASLEALQDLERRFSTGDLDDLAGQVHGLAAPVPRPGKMLYAAANYRDHVAETRRWTGAEAPPVDRARARPYSFVKLPDCVIGPEDPVVLPDGCEQIDWEVELALVIGRRARRVPAERALDHVAGFLVANDVSCRDLTVRPDWPSLRTDWLGGKNFDTFAPLGPWLVARQSVPDHRDLRLRLWVNGELKQDGNSGQMTFSPEEQIEYLSGILTLNPGDVIATGTPAGVGFGRGEYLRPGDVMEAEVEGLGRQRTLVVAETAAVTSDRGRGE